MDLYFSRSRELGSTAANDETAAVTSAAGGNLLRNDPQSRFDIYRTDCVKFTSTLNGGGDWHWRLTDASGTVIADCGGYPDEVQCLTAVSAVRAEAAFARVPFTKMARNNHNWLKAPT